MESVAAGWPIDLLPGLWRPGPEPRPRQPMTPETTDRVSAAGSSRGGSAGAADGEDPGGLAEVTMVAPPGSRTTVWNDPSGSWLAVDPSALPMEYSSAPSAVVPVVAPGPAAGSGPTVGAGGVGGCAGSTATVQAAGPARVGGWAGSSAAAGTVEAPGSVEVATAVQASGSAAVGEVCDAVSSGPVIGGGSHSAPGPKKNLRVCHPSRSWRGSITF
jgi:hypothetical protein